MTLPENSFGQGQTKPTGTIGDEPHRTCRLLPCRRNATRIPNSQPDGNAYYYLRFRYESGRTRTVLL
jgi:hypothetical protein